MLPKSTNQLTAEGIFIGSESKLRKLIQPLLAVGNPTLTIENLPYDTFYANSNSGPRSFANWLFTSSWVYKPLPQAALTVIENFMTTAPAPACNFWCLNWGGATGTPPLGGSPFPWRTALYYAEPGAGWNDPAQTGPTEIWLAQFRQAMRPFVGRAHTSTFPTTPLGTGDTLYYGPNFARLRQVKSAYDPLNVFTFEQSIPPVS